MKRILSLALLAGAAALVAAGCHSSHPSVEVKVTLDSAPVEGATVTFIQDGGAVTASGLTDANGVCKLSTGGKAGVPTGKYKATVTKIDQSVAGAENMDPTAAMKAAAGIKDGKMAGDLGRAPGGVGAVTQKNQLPAKYGDANKTPFTGIEIPAKGQVALELKAGG